MLCTVPALSVMCLQILLWLASLAIVVLWLLGLATVISTYYYQSQAYSIRHKCVLSIVCFGLQMTQNTRLIFPDKAM